MQFLIVSSLNEQLSCFQAFSFCPEPGKGMAGSLFMGGEIDFRWMRGCFGNFFKRLPAISCISPRKVIYL
ncbi:hypothetical protein STRDD11_00593 [Streptococcus sp. DD11]|nr:hypothetical protein STRDD11_00593 [Streptococcus sp. DD11]